MPETQDTTANSSTPIFDSGVLPPRTSQITLQSLLLGFLIGTVPFLSAVILIMAGRQGNDSLDVSLLSACLVLVVATFVHEAGHLLAGWAVGFRFSRIQLGPLSLSIAQGRLRVRLREMTALGYAGMHVNRLRRLRRRMLIFLAAGPATNLLSLLVMVLLLYFFPQLINAWVAIPAAQFAVVSCLLGMLSLWPFPSTGSSDGARIMMLLRSRDRARRWLNILALIHAHDQGTPVKLCKNSWLRAASSLNDASRDNFRGNWLAYILQMAETTRQLQRFIWRSVLNWHACYRDRRATSWHWSPPSLQLGFETMPCSPTSGLLNCKNLTVSLVWLKSG